jgi:hypothetical protein
MGQDERLYFAKRAEAELALARTAPHPNAARAHYIIAGHYLDRAHNGREPVRHPVVT